MKAFALLRIRLEVWNPPLTHFEQEGAPPRFLYCFSNSDRVSEEKIMQSKDPLEAAVDEGESPPESPVAPDLETPVADGGDEEIGGRSNSTAATAPSTGPAGAAATGAEKAKDDEDEEEDENMDVDIGKLPSGDPDKMAKMQAILSEFTEEQMNRYESFRRSGFQKANMKRVKISYLEIGGSTLPHHQIADGSLLASLCGTPKISVPMTIVVSGIAKMFVGELVELGRMVMTERKETGPIRPCHIREAYRRLKLEGKIPRRSVSRLFR
ncbi:hypothetical protein ACLOJK_008538 [Asimina triloba]